MNGKDKHHMTLLEVDDGGYSSCQGCHQGGEGFHFRPLGECPTPYLTREQLQMRLDNALAEAASLREYLAQRDSSHTVPGPGEPTAWLHTMRMESGQSRSVPTMGAQSPFGICGKDFDPSYTVESKPLYTIRELNK